MKSHFVCFYVSNMESLPTKSVVSHPLEDERVPCSLAELSAKYPLFAGTLRAVMDIQFKHDGLKWANLFNWLWHSKLFRRNVYDCVRRVLLTAVVNSSDGTAEAYFRLRRFNGADHAYSIAFSEYSDSVVHCISTSSKYEKCYNTPCSKDVDELLYWNEKGEVVYETPWYQRLWYLVFGYFLM